MGTWYDARESLARTLNFRIEHAQQRYFRKLQQSVGVGIHWLDLGCGRQLVPEWAAPRSQQQEIASRAHLVGIDVDSALGENTLVHHKVMALGERLPFRDGTFDLVTANMVMEHLEQPEAILAEIRRVLRVGGKLLFHTPNLRHPAVRVSNLVPEWIQIPIVRVLERRHQRDVFKTYYRANTGRVISRLARHGSYAVESIDIGGSVGVMVKLGPLGVAEVFLLKLLSLPAFSRWNTTIIAILAKVD